MRPIIAAAAGVLILMGACAPEPEDAVVPVAQAPSAAPGQAAPPDDGAIADCKARSGEMQRVGLLGSWQCIVRYADAGKRCTDGDQCQGDCRAGTDLPPPPRSGEPAPPARTTPPPTPTEGVCQADSNDFGCYAVIENGQARPMICVD